MAPCLCRVLIATAKPLDRLADQDLLAYDRAMRNSGREPVRLEMLWGALRHLGIVKARAPTLKAARHPGPATVEELVDRYQLECRPVRDLLVQYVAERAPALDYNSTSNIAFWLAALFWRDLERHHPGISSLRLPPEVARSWKQRLRARLDGNPRTNLHGVLLTVRAFYHDINQWAYEDPGRWAQWAAPCPVSKADLASGRKRQAATTARMHARTRTLAPLLPRLTATARERFQHASGLLSTAVAAPPEATITVDQVTYRRAVGNEGSNLQTWVRRLDDGSCLDARYEEAEAFWAWACIDVLRLSGLRIEEMLELTHLSVRRYVQSDGEVVPLMQVAPSKIEVERVFPISPELAHVLARVIDRVRTAAPDNQGERESTVPLVSRYDGHERTFGPMLPHLFQRPFGSRHQVFSPATVRNWLDRTATRAHLRDVDDRPLRLTPHDFRRLFATDVVNSGLPIHIAAALLGHRTLDTTRGYTAIYPEEVLRSYQAFILARRACRPSGEYREPTKAEWDEFEQHFTLRKVALGNCDRPYGTPCIHEHACVRCPMLRPDPTRLELFNELQDNLAARIAEARERVWLGEVAGLEQTLTALREKKQHLERLAAEGITDAPALLA
jgi:integrase